MRDPDICDCGTTYEEEDGTIIHFEDCALIQSKLVIW